METIKTVLKKTFLNSIIRNFRNWQIANVLTKHEKQMFVFYSQFISPGDLCFDIGANAGNRTKIFLKLGAKVIAVEPQLPCVNRLFTIFGKNKNLQIITKALGAKEGEAEFLISDVDVISSLSHDWIETVKKSGRFGDNSWDKKETVQLTTMDTLIERYGIPTFIKIDVEGYEFEVFKGLTRPVHTISFEFTPEFLENTFNCISYLEALGDIRLNYSLGETMALSSQEWLTSTKIKNILEGFRSNTQLFGDIYVQFSK
jgi:FkbM family methyltransferase